MKKIKLYTDFNIAKNNIENLSFIFTAILFNNNKNNFPSQPDFGYELVDESNSADFFVLPINWEWIKALNLVEKSKPLINLAKEKNKKIIAFYYDDDDKDLGIDNSIVFRTSLNKSQQRVGSSINFAMPSWREDIKVINFKNNYFLSKKEEKPKIGFRGCSQPIDTFEIIKNDMIKNTNRISYKISKKSILREKWYYDGYKFRADALKVLKNNKKINSDITITSMFGDKKFTMSQNKKLFIDNIINNNYVLCTRGGGNYSYRFYETIICGRIPVFINTDCVLPYDFCIDWKKYVVWVEENEINKIDKILLDFHNSISDEGLLNLQLNIRKLYEEYISPIGFINNLHKHFEHLELLKNQI
ncbi:MAG: exostosin family protein [Bacteroidales bacterium]|nr:exostosin family protein [Bacteroidales bacterium]